MDLCQWHKFWLRIAAVLVGVAALSVQCGILASTAERLTILKRKGLKLRCQVRDPACSSEAWLPRHLGGGQMFKGDWCGDTFLASDHAKKQTCAGDSCPCQTW